MNASSDAVVGIQLKDLKGIWRRRKGVMAAVAGLVFLAFMIVAFVLRSQYQAFSVLLIEPQVIDEMFVRNGVTSKKDMDIAGRLHIMSMEILSRPRLSKLIDRYELYSDDWDRYTREEIIVRMRDDIVLEPILPQYQLEMMQGGAFRGDIEINTFKLHFKYHKAKAAADVVNALSQDFINEHIKGKVEVAEGTEDFVRSRLESVMRNLEDTDRRIAQIKQDNIGALPDDLDSNRRLLQWTGDDLRRAKQNQRAYLDQILVYQQLANSATLEQTTPEKQLEMLRLELNQYRSDGKTEKHPDVRNKIAEVAALEARLKAEKATGTEFDGLNDNQRASVIQLRRAEASVKDVEAEVRALEARMSEIEEKIARTPHVGEEIASLEISRKAMLEEYEEMQRKLGSASAQTSLESKMKGEHFRVLETAFTPQEPVAPNRPLLLALGFFVGIVLGGVAGMVLETVDSSFHDSRTIQDRLKIPVLAAIPSILLESDIVAMRRQRWRIGVAASAVALFAVVVSAIAYVSVNRIDLLRSEKTSTPSAEASATPQENSAPDPAAAENPSEAATEGAAQ